MGWPAIVLAGFSAAASPPREPLQLRVDDAGGQIVISLVGESPTAIAAAYELEVTGGVRGAANRSTQRGTARLQAGQPVTVAALRLGDARDAKWIARLHVTPTVGAPYDLEWRSAR